MNPEAQRACLIVNADDYGYFDFVSRGILHAARQGIVTATGIFANSPHFQEHVDWLAGCDGLDFGVHLNLTDREPLTVDMRQKLSRWAGRFPRKYTVAGAVLSGALDAETVKREWRAQIERCLDKGLEIRFLNSHEHVHMLPPLFRVIQALAVEYGVPHVRFPAPKPFRSWAAGALVRDILMTFLVMVGRRHLVNPVADFLGMEISGKLTADYLQDTLTTLRGGRVYELMCHPGHGAETDVADPRLLHYHNWEGEFRTLTNPTTKKILDSNSVQLIGYRHLQIRPDRLIVSEENGLH